MLCYIFLLHQTTTCKEARWDPWRCVISFFYIKPQPLHRANCSALRCVISFFYIKPQPRIYFEKKVWVVLYLSSTSNHNNAPVHIDKSKLCYIFLLHQTTTKRQSTSRKLTLCYIFLLHQTTTQSYNMWNYVQLCYIFLLHQTTTQKHKLTSQMLLCYIFLLHQTTTQLWVLNSRACCVISFFYIKPQR